MIRLRNLVGCVVVLVSATWVLGQGGANGTILGTVTDNSGAVVTGAGVDITNNATGVNNHTQTSSTGDFAVPYLAPGTYKVSVSAPGFQKAVVDNVGLVVAQQARVNVALKPGTINESIEVQAAAVALDTDSSSVSQLVSQKQVEQLPLNGRNFLSLLFIGPGAVQTNGEQGQMRQGAGNAISINGGRPESNNYTLDGMVNTDTALNTPAVVLSQDAIQEFKVQSETYSAEYGFSANQVNIVSKSGTNQLHGSAFEFARNDAFDAKAPFQPSIPELRQNQFGFVLGGPVYIPKVYDGRNKTFWLANYEGWRIRNGVSSNMQVPDPAQLGGDFSASGLAAYGSANCGVSGGSPCMPIDPETGAPFPGNIIDPSRFSRLAQVAVQAGLFPAPNCPDPSACQGKNFHLATALPASVDQQTYKLDQNIGHFGSVFFRWTNSNYSNQNAGTATLPFGNAVFTSKNQSWQVSHTIALKSTIVNNFRFGHLEAIFNQGGVPAPATDVAALNFSGIFSDPPSSARLYPGIGFQGITTTGGGNTAFGSQVNDVTTSDVPTWEFADSVSMTRGRHTFAVGFDYRRWIQKRNLANDFLGQPSFNNDTIVNNSNGCQTASGLCGTSNAVADFLLGYYNGDSTFQPGPFSPAGVAGNLNQYHFQYFAPYVQDDWKVNSRLTLNLGLRWDFRTIPYEQSNKMFWYDVSNPNGGLCFADKGLQADAVSSLGGPIAPDGNGFYRYCGRHNPTDSSKTPFAPRLGFAWRPFGEKTVVRGGYGIFWDSSLTREIDNSGDIYPFLVRTNENPTQNPNLPKLTDQLFPPVSLHQVSPATDGGQFFAVIISERPRNPYVQQWSFSVQRELARNTTLEVNYVGNKGLHLLNRVNIIQPPPPADAAYCAAHPNESTPNHCTVQSRRPLSNLTGFADLDSHWDGYSNYNAANVKLERRTTSMAFLVAYTWAKSLDDKSAPAGIGATGGGFAGHMDDLNPRLDYGRSDFDVNHRFVASYVYSLPIGRGKRFLGNMNKLEDALIGGWQLTGIATFQKGFPYSVLAQDQLGLLNTFSQRADLLPGCNPNGGFHKSLNEWFNTACFTPPAAGVFGNSGRNILRQPGINNWDMGLGKNFAFTERVNFQLRIETFNTFNHAQYGVDPGSAGVGPGQSSVNSTFQAGASTVSGAVVSARPGRIVQLGGKLTF